MVSMDEICGYVRNYFLRDYINPGNYIHSGTYTIADGSIQDLPFLIPGQWFRITGSALNNGVYKYPATDLSDETFTGTIWEMYVPPDFVSLATEISEWTDSNEEALNGPYQSESFAGYSYSKSYVSRSNGAVTVAGWQSQFGARLSRYRRLSVI